MWSPGEPLPNDQAGRSAVRDWLIQEIERAFAEVRIDGGVTLSEVAAIELGAGPEKRALARQRDRYRHWSEILLDERDPTRGALHWMDATGYAFHVPAYLVSWLRTSIVGLDGFDADAHGLESLFLPSLLDESDGIREKQINLTTEQRRTIALSLLLCLACEEDEAWTTDREGMVRALSRNWLDALRSTERASATRRWPELGAAGAGDRDRD